MITRTHGGHPSAARGETAHAGGRVDARTRGRQDARGAAGGGQAQSPRRQARRAGGRWSLGLLWACVLLSGSGARAFGATRTPPADLACSLTQLTHAPSGASGSPAINAAGTRIAFTSTANLTEDNADGTPELFLVDTTTDSFTQLTHPPGGASGSPAINAAGTRIAFESSANLTGDNADGNIELFLVDTTTGSLTQLTHTGSAGSFEPAINAAGTRIAFTSTANLTGDNADGTPELFLVDTTTDSFTQLTHIASFASFLSTINAAGTRIAFESSANLTGDNADGNIELFLVDTTTGSLTQLTHTGSAGSFEPAINAAGTRIAFTSTANLAEDNADGTFEIFLVDTTTGSFTQLTHAPRGDSGSPAINAAGTRIAFTSTANLTGDNADHAQEIFLMDTTTGSLTQLTHAPRGDSLGFSFEPAINAAGTRIAFASSANLTGDNADNNFEIFLATCLAVVNDLVTFAPLPTTYQTTADVAGCPAGFGGTFRFAARLTAKPSSPTLADLRVQVHTLTHGHLLQNADGGPGGPGATVTVPQADAFADGLLRPAEAVDVPLVLCLQERSPFRLTVDVLGRVSDEGT